MNDILQTMGVASSGMRAQATRMRHISENMANSDTPGYRRKLVSFEEQRGGDNAGGVIAGPLQLDQTELTSIHDPSHPLADANGNYDGSNVNMIIEVADAREAQRSYEANLRMFDQARKMTTAALELLRR